MTKYTILNYLFRSIQQKPHHCASREFQAKLFAIFQCMCCYALSIYIDAVAAMQQHILFNSFFLCVCTDYVDFHLHEAKVHLRLCGRKYACICNASNSNTIYPSVSIITNIFSCYMFCAVCVFQFEIPFFSCSFSISPRCVNCAMHFPTHFHITSSFVYSGKVQLVSFIYYVSMNIKCE